MIDALYRLAFASAPADEPIQDGGLPRLPNRPSYATEIRAQLRVTRYDGLERGQAGTHEIVEGDLLSVRAANAKEIDSLHVRVAMKVARASGEGGLPRELPLRPGQVIELEGEYVPAARADVRRSGGSEAVVHFTHGPGGFVIVGGTEYD